MHDRVAEARGEAPRKSAIRVATLMMSAHMRRGMHCEQSSWQGITCWRGIRGTRWVPLIGGAGAKRPAMRKQYARSGCGSAGRSAPQISYPRRNLDDVCSYAARHALRTIKLAGHYMLEGY